MPLQVGLHSDELSLLSLDASTVHDVQRMLVQCMLAMLDSSWDNLDHVCTCDQAVQ